MSTELLEARSMECASFIDHRLRDLQDEHGDEQLPKTTYQDVIAEGASNSRKPRWTRRSRF
jgi:hypothetical protein